ncbi:hypothetical protein [Ochrobactrum sp. BTU1]|uniref:hypothetical protein n=1 Tax=Ochrobactrum sp. BTU1 TaxID=2840456 RepID=UPI001C05D60D|nr:hypothetical protein KMS41_23350 [Ochrobactrum sp. BTU1]
MADTDHSAHRELKVRDNSLRWRYDRCTKARDREDDTRFVAGLSGQKMRADDMQQRYFWKGYYPNFERGPFADYGIAQLSTVEKSKRDQYFAITMSARAVGP